MASINNQKLNNGVQVFFGGVVGATLRFVIQTSVGTLPMLWFVNILGSFLLGSLNGYYERNDSKLKLFFTTGMLGAFTTFSTFSEQAIYLLKENTLVGLLFVLGMSVASITAALVGYLLNRGRKQW
ncbi:MULTISPECIES: CrcB family protein [Lysinibacillus]|uniref:Fluoride-specific ion channel FluC n=1 Tax=Lysinibacillus antri TaxID=2498145 RepID=A0A432LGA3_9BACI|nr:MULTISPECIES: CrcB family protein [Lysinibacillus]RUL56898.1 CrcB family protein [Lysinibacillus antri]TSI08613.1 CrcB family protein [Lysinibacillus sp. BW-2-10]